MQFSIYPDKNINVNVQQAPEMKPDQIMEGMPMQYDNLFT